jgi:hypothetical protein
MGSEERARGLGNRLIKSFNVINKGHKKIDSAVTRVIEDIGITRQSSIKKIEQFFDPLNGPLANLVENKIRKIADNAKIEFSPSASYLANLYEGFGYFGNLERWENLNDKIPRKKRFTKEYLELRFNCLSDDGKENFELQLTDAAVEGSLKEPNPINQHKLALLVAKDFLTLVTYDPEQDIGRRIDSLKRLKHVIFKLEQIGRSSA